MECSQGVVQLNEVEEAGMKKSKSTRYRLEARKSPIAGRVCSQPRSAKGASAIMELEEGKNIDGFDKGNAAALVCFLLRQKGKV